MLGLLQTVAFMREMADGEEFLEDNGITPGNLGPLIAAKIRRQSILHKGGRRVVHVTAMLRRPGAAGPQPLSGRLIVLLDVLAWHR